ncbi:hypothetical protein CBM2587_A120079 [Cupriavidus taiwanensis]|uniref:Uncharacterized protein n=1 Tax=Cupriavidus taiwanensis TaxID=164546 RepID=A0A375BHG3_9BURK|nr:hypothetical protein CBM2587_A120079 [Cupriavidus taiwanensis]
MHTECIRHRVSAQAIAGCADRSLEGGEVVSPPLARRVVRGRGLEPLHHCWRQDLNLVRLPISPPSRSFAALPGRAAALLVAGHESKKGGWNGPPWVRFVAGGTGCRDMVSARLAPAVQRGCGL